MILQKYLYSFKHTSISLVLRSDFKGPVHLRRIYVESQQALRAKQFITISGWSNLSHRKTLKAHTVHKPEKQHRTMGSELNLISVFTICYILHQYKGW